MDEGCGATMRTEKGETDREEGKERRRTRETESEGYGGSERRIKKKPTGGQERDVKGGRNDEGARWEGMKEGNEEARQTEGDNEGHGERRG